MKDVQQMKKVPGDEGCKEMKEVQEMKKVTGDEGSAEDEESTRR